MKKKKFASKNQKITFDHSKIDTRFEIYTMYPDGRGLKRLGIPAEKKQ